MFVQTKSTEHYQRPRWVENLKRFMPRSELGRDCLFLSAIVLLSFIRYVGDLGFYGVDWHYLGRASTAEYQTPFGIFQSLYGEREMMRPLQWLQISSLYWLFGAHPLGYHLCNTVVLMTNALLLYLVLRLMNRRRILCLAAAVLYALLPHYSSTRFWIYGFAANLSMSFYLLNLYSDLRALSVENKRFWKWKVLSLISLTLSILLYEVALPLFLLNPLLVWYRGRQLHERAPKGRIPFKELVRTDLKMLFGVNLLLLMPIVIFKVLTTVRMGKLLKLPRNIGLIIMGAFSFDYKIDDWGLNYIHAVAVAYGDYGVKLPQVMWKIWCDYPNPIIFAMTVAVGLFIFVYLYLAANETKAGFPSAASMIKFIKWGLVVFGLGYAIFLTNYNVQFTSTGIANRTAVAATVGVALTHAGIGGWLSTLPRSQRRRRILYCFLIALLAASGFLINNTLASFWTTAYRQEQTILAAVRKEFPKPSKEMTLLLDGSCPYLGPAGMFEADGELAGALRLMYRCDAPRTDVVRSNIEVMEDGLVMQEAGSEYRYPYDKLFIYHVGQRKTYELKDADTARHYFKSINRDLKKTCPESHDGIGMPVF